MRLIVCPPSRQFSHQRSAKKSQNFLVSAGFLLLVLCLTSAVRAQQGNTNAAATSALTLQNLSRVAASAAQIKEVLLKDAGLLVELKRWFAKDASDHGQVVSDSDLTDYAIFERLEADIQFRSAATVLLQKYGYLVPKVNPESELGQEQALLIQERAKWIAHNEEEELTLARQQVAEKMKRPGACESQQLHTQQDCGVQPASPSPPLFLQPGGNQEDRNNENSSPQREQLLRTDAGSSTYLEAISQFSPGSSPVGSDDVSTAGTKSLSAQMGDDISRPAFRPTAGGASTPLGATFSDGLLNAYGLGAGSYTGMDNSPTRLFGAGNQMSGALPGAPASGGAAPNMGTSSAMQLPVRSYVSQPRSQPVSMTRRPMPYGDLPSLYDMYIQAVAHPTTPRRFGTEVFENGTRDPQLIPMDLPVGPDYVIGPGDGLSIDLWGGVSQRLYRTVDREGRISLPEIGPILVSGKSLAAAQSDLQQILRTQFRDISADVGLSRLRTIRVYEVGDVMNPGAYDISSLSTPLNALFSAGGPTQQGSMRIVRHYRGNQLVQTVDLYDLLLHGVKTDLERLQNGDSVQVPPIGPQVTIEGMVRRPAIYELKDEKNLATVLELAGGLLPAATLRHIEVQRLIAHQSQTMLSLDIPEADNNTEVTKKLEAFEVVDGDRIRIYPIAPYNQDTVYVDGHVIRPGRYAYHANMRVTDVLSSYKDLLPEPATQYAEIIRLNEPDFRPSIESFNLAAALENPGQAPLLHPMDTVRVFSRFNFEDAPTVSVLGDVREPGTYQTSGQIRLADAVHLAGGLAADAETNDAQIFRYQPDGKSKIFSVSLSQALAGDPASNIILQPRDRILVHRSTDAVQPATVYIQGEVAKPGRYPLTTNMRVSDLIQVGGGLKPSADTQQADLVTYSLEDPAKLTGRHKAIAIATAMTGEPNSDVALHNGDVLTIRQTPGWGDLGASINVKGEVKHPGVYGIRPGERLSAILERAGGFQPDAYPYGAVLQREQVRELESQAQIEMILRVKESQSALELLPDKDPAQKQAKEASLQQWQTTLDQLSANPPLGRVTVRISSNLMAWKNTPADIEVRAGDTLTIPKRPSYVMVTGQVFNATAIAYRPGKSAKWYLSQAGGPTPLANRKSIFVTRADGSVVGSKKGLWTGDSLNASLRPGDTVVVPEKPFGGPVQWQTVFAAAQLASSVANTVFFALHY